MSPGAKAAAVGPDGATGVESVLPRAKPWPGTPRLSVVVPTYRRPRLLRRCLQALLAQTLPPQAYEVIVVDDGHEPRVRAELAEFARQPGGPRLRYLCPARGRGPAVARNCGWRAARGEIVAFTDDDTIPAPDWLEQGERTLQAHPDWSAAAGAVEVPRARPDAPPTDHELMTQGLARAEFVTANALVRREALERVDGFDERFQRAWREDSDLQFRLIELAGPVGRAPGARVQHPVRPEAWGVCLRQQKNTFFDALLFKKHPRLYRERIRRVPPWDYYLVVALSLAAPLLGGAGHAPAAALCGAGALALVLWLAARRLRDTDRSPRHAIEMLVTSALIPFLSVYWRLRGALHFRVFFL
jgi:glycosyltransferase involved in cell wall biosynthesis